MSAQDKTDQQPVKHRHRTEGPQKHVVVFIFSIILTLIAFAVLLPEGSTQPLSLLFCSSWLFFKYSFNWVIGCT